MFNESRLISARIAVTALAAAFFAGVLVAPAAVASATAATADTVVTADTAVPCPAAMGWQAGPNCPQ